MAGEGVKSRGPLQSDSKDWDKLLGEGAEPLSLVVVPGKSPQAKEMDEKVSNNQLVSDLQNMTDEQLQQSADRIRRILPTLSLTMKDGGEKLKRSLQLHEDELRRRRLLPLQKKNSGHNKYIHNKIELYDEMAVVVGKDLATGSFAKSFVDLETPFVPKTSVEQKDVTSARSSEVRATSSGTKQHRKRYRSNEDIEKMSQQLGEVAKSFVDLETPFVPKTSVETSVEQKDVTSARSSEVRATSSGTKQHRKRNCSNEDIEKMSQQLGEVAAALNKISANKLDINQLHDEIMKIEGYSEEFLDLVFDHLVQNEKLGKAFMAKSQRLRLISLERFKKDWGVE
ncbi:uncharacterized protein [Coffea arabica]|uniref:Uncharacterized protein n=1 Tax=Coffea arabica TaxID=13443 RepID=A0ABM4WBJ5_COFAR